MAAVRAVRAVAALLSADDLQDVEDLLGSSRRRDAPAPAQSSREDLETLQQVAWEAESRARQQEAAIQAERDEVRAELEELREQVQQCQALREENAELRQLVGKLHSELLLQTEQQELKSGQLEASRLAGSQVAERLVELVGRSRSRNEEVRQCFLRWHLRTAKRSAQIAERARLRMEHMARMEKLMTQRSPCAETFRAWAQYKDQKHRSSGLITSNSRIQVFRYFSAWRRLCISMSYLQQLRWCEPSSVCTPEFASAVWQELSSPRVYRSFLLPQEGSNFHLNVPHTG